MKKVITAVLAAAFALNSTVFAGYYEQREITPFDGNSIAYEKYDIAQTDKLVQEIKQLMNEPGSDEEISELLDKAYDEYVKSRYASTAAQIMSDRYYSDKSSGEALEAAAISIDVAEKLGLLLENVYNNGYSRLLESALDMDAEEVHEFIDTIPSERFYGLVRRENELVNKYSSVYGDSNACAELYIELVNLRNEMAREENYSNYADFANAEIYDRDYSTGELEEFSDAVSRFISPLWRALLGLGSTPLGGEYKSKTDEELIASVGEMMYDINTELGDSYRYMIDNDLYDIELREGKNSSAGAYTVFLDGKNIPYLFLSEKEDSPWRVTTFIHESGHFCSILNTPGLDEKWLHYVYSMSTDTCEIHSQALEMLSEHYFGKLFGSYAASERINETLAIVSCIMDGCFFNEWQTRMYNEKDLTVDKADEIAAELMDKYYGLNDVLKSDAQNIWTGVQHNFLSPMYYVSYAVSAAAALEIYALSVDDYDDAVDKYMKLSAIGGFVPFRSAIEEAGLDDVFDTETVRYISRKVGEGMGFGYIDTDYSEWYMPYIIKTAGIADGRAEELFEPGSNITRGEFMQLVGKMYDYYEGIDGEYALTFNDVDESDDSAGYIMWASANGIIDGYSESSFGPDDEITREQAVTILYRMCQYENGSPQPSLTSIDLYDDSSEVSYWAVEKLSWAADCGIINGRDNKLAPLDSTTRAEAAAIASRYIDLMY